MHQVSQVLITKHRNKQLHSYLNHYAALAKNLTNAALFRVRNNFTARSKDALTENEGQVMNEIQKTEETYGFSVRKVISYTHLEKLMRVTENVDFFAGLPMQTAQAQLKQCTTDFRSWLKALNAYKKDPSAFTGKPQMPGYIKSNFATFTITNQDAVLYPTPKGEGSFLKLPKFPDYVYLKHVNPDAKLKEVKVKPFYDSFILSLTLEVETAPVLENAPYFAAIDFGLNNAAAIVTNEGSALLYKGGAMKAANQWYNKERARLTSIITKNHKYMKPESARLNHLSMNRHFFLKDQMHKISRSIVLFCIEHKIGTLILGQNKQWKQNSDIGTANNQAFVGMPIHQLQMMIEYKASNAGICVIYQEESYTSKADFLAQDLIPTYGVDDQNAFFSGKRIKRGLYMSQNGIVFNADLNGAANILRKCIPGAFRDAVNFDYLQKPIVYGFHKLNRKSIPV